MNRMKDFTAHNPTGTSPGIEQVNLNVLRAAVANEAAAPAIVEIPAVATQPQLTAKNLRLPADLVDFIDYVYTKDNRMKKQDAYTLALESFFRPLMAANSKTA
jgi:acyl CoA:acetate/3-ketoacid CoA transferase